MSRQAKILTAIVAALFVAVLAVACKGEKKGEANKKAGNSTGKVIVTLAGGKDVVTWEEINSTYHIDKMRQGIQDEQLQRLLDNVVKQHLLYLDGVEKKYDQDPEYIMQVERAKRQYMNRLVMQKMSNQQVNVTDQDVSNYYTTHPDEFNMLKVEYILLSSRKYDNNIEKTKQEAAAALKMLKGGAAIDEVAKKYLGRDEPFQIQLRKGQASFFGKAFDDVVWTLEPGATTDLIETGQGIIIARVNEKATQTLEESKGYIQSVMSRQKSSGNMDSYIEELKKKYTVQIDQAEIDKLIQEIQSAPPPPPPPGGNPPGVPGPAGVAPIAPPPGLPAGHP